MKPLRSIGTMAAVFLLAFSLSLYSFKTARGSDHQDSPTVVSNPLADVTDVYAFPDPHDASRVAMIMDVRPLIPSGMTAGIALDPNVLYQFKVATQGVASGSFTENTVLQFTADSTGTSQQISLYGPAAPNEVGTTNTVVGKTGTFPFGKVTKLSNGIEVFVGPRRDPFFFDLAQFFKIVPDRNYANQPNPPPPTASSFRFASASATDRSQRRELRNGRIERLRHRQAARFARSVQRHFDRRRDAQETARPTRRNARRHRPVGDHRHARRPVGIRRPHHDDPF